MDGLADRLGADGLDQSQDHQFVGQRPQGPVAAALGRVAASQPHQPPLDIPLDLDLVWPGRLGVGVEGLLEALSDQAFADPPGGTDPDPQGIDYLVVGVSPSGGGIRQRQDTGVGELAGSRLAGRDQLLQFVPLFGGQGNSVLLHGGTPFLGKQVIARFTRYGSPATYQSKVDGILVGPVAVVRDNGRYQRDKVVRAPAAELGVDLVYRPSYSPNLNLIERPWGFAKRWAVYGK